MSQTIKGAVAKRDNEAMTQITTYRGDFATMLPSHLTADTWIRSAQALLRKDWKLRKVANANPGSFLAALLDCARWGLEPGVTYHLVPFGSEVVGIRDYKGIVELMYRAGAVSNVHVEIVYEHDDFDYDRRAKEPPSHQPPTGPNGKPNWAASRDARGKMTLAYAYAEMKDGGISQVVIMPEWEILEHRDASKMANSPDSLWQKWPRAAWKKTVARELEKWVPSSPEWITHKVRAERAGQEPQRQLSAAALTLPPPIVDDEVLDGEVIDQQAAATAPARNTRPAQQPTKERDPDAVPAARPVSKTRMNVLFRLLAKGNVTTADGRLRLASHVLELDQPLADFTQLTAEQVENLITRLEQLDASGQLGATPAAETPTVETPVEQPPTQDTKPEGEQ